MSEIEVGFELELETTVQEFDSRVDEFKKALAEVIWGEGDNDIDLITIMKIVSGSVVINGAVQAASSSGENEIFETLSTDLSANSEIMGYHVMSAQY